MKYAVILLCAAGFATTIEASPFCTVSPGTWCEKEAGDAGGMIDSAEATMGSGPLNFIFGQISDGLKGADMFSVLITDPSTFSAAYTPSGNKNVVPDGQAGLYLFDSSGMGIEAVDDGSAALGAFAGPAGIYYIAVVPDGDDPEYKTGPSAFAPIFSAFVSGASTPVGGAGPLKKYSQNGCGTNCEGGYEVSFLGGGVQSSNLPEPASVILTGSALVALAVRSRKSFRMR